MITIVAGTNRPHSRARRVANLYAALLREYAAPHQILDLVELPADFLTTALYDNAGLHTGFNHLAQQASDADKLVFIVPEYNCSFPGALKAFIDGLPYPGGIRGKKAALVGLSSGGQGGLLALSHLTDVLMYLGTAVLPQRVRLPFIDQHLTDDGQLTHPLYLQLLREQAELLLRF
ncbi:NAD(P)H-dependent oxidoreductase [Hymenobacter busanensis]|uniref:NAD(P)H-dependent oxidoreductase n=1 Tax=Hymenobacter busanensis TaxID=2607656 RepID=A0A7L4ZVA0_9BACT|nr:NAD(P)H-dependent oxidoreductase [Hymenobacter busanensis]KAA9339120.1 NAD(P)H-dependent oxidoreductase [Hymenobacter busanensis]QHJ07118.1 NADPH-dependent FMN reductase [Hymenobacter busanensis]